MFDTVAYDQVIDAHAYTLLWSSTDTEGTPLDQDYYIEDIERESRQAMDAEVMSWMDTNERIVSLYFQSSSPTLLGHDLALTRNGHGVGFWDRGLGDLGDELTEAAKLLGPIYLIEDGNGALIAH